MLCSLCGGMVIFHPFYSVYLEVGAAVNIFISPCKWAAFPFSLSVGHQSL